jgi:Bacterial transglutaminase-like cysteine proteinase BTLCP
VLAPRPEQLIQWFRSTCLGLPESPWERLSMDVPAIAFGPGSRCQFGHYFEGQSSVPVASIDDIVGWLNTCEYASDTDQFNDRDVWQEPCAFEQRRRGDCEDFALWAWRKLGELGIDAEFFVGRVICGEDPTTSRQHAWVVYRVRHRAFLFEPAARDRQRMIRPLEEARDRYVPHFSVNTRLVTSAFVGCVLDPDPASPGGTVLAAR